MSPTTRYWGRWIGAAMAAGGLILLVIALLADEIGIGGGERAEFGGRQLAATAVGAVVLVIGVITFVVAARAHTD